MTPQINSFLTFHSKIALTSQLIFEMLVQSQRNENGSIVFNIGAYYPNFGSQDWMEFKALQVSLSPTTNALVDDSGETET